VAKSQAQFECQSCGALYPRWQGKCDQCQAWNSLIEVRLSSSSKSKKTVASPSKAQKLSDISTDSTQRVSTSIGQLDLVLGQGLVPGSVTLLGGEPGIGKSTLSLQLAMNTAQTGLSVLYISAEESPSQIQLRAQRLGTAPESLFVVSEMNIESIIQLMETQQPDLVILDSIQVVYHPEISSTGGTVSQVRSCANEFIDWIKKHQKMAVLIGHITKEGSLAGPKVLEHMVDVILYLEGERNHHYRILRCYKNRFATTSELGVFEMTESGLMGVDNHSERFLSDASLEHPGSIVSAAIDGNRVFLVEIQALVVPCGQGVPRRSFVGVDPHRGQLVIAALEKMVGVKFSGRDVFLNIIGGLKLSEPAIDLAVALAMISSVDNRAPSKKVAALGEVGLTGEIRPIPELEKRLNDLKKMGFHTCYIPKRSRVTPSEDGTLELVYVNHVSDAIRHFVSHHAQAEYSTPME